MQQGQASDAADFSFYRKSFEGKFRRCSRASCRSISQLGQVVDEDFFLHRRPLGFIGVFFSSPLVQAGFFFASSLLRLALLSSFVFIISHASLSLCSWNCRRFPGPANGCSRPSSAHGRLVSRFMLHVFAARGKRNFSLVFIVVQASRPSFLHFLGVRSEFVSRRFG